MCATQNQRPYPTQFFHLKWACPHKSSSPYANFRRNKIAHICAVPLMPGNTLSDVMSESRKLFVLMSNKLFTAGDIFGYFIRRPKNRGFCKTISHSL